MKVGDLSAELAGCQFGDVRLTKRARKLTDVFSQKPNISIPAAVQSKADIEACYRFFNNDKVTPEKILQPHIEQTYQRIRPLDFVFVVQDTTELDLTRPEPAAWKAPGSLFIQRTRFPRSQCSRLGHFS